MRPLAALKFCGFRLAKLHSFQQLRIDRTQATVVRVPRKLPSQSGTVPRRRAFSKECRE
jgi:hypothetical protein